MNDTKVVALKLRPLHVRLWRHYKGYRDINLGVMDSLSGALRLAMLTPSETAR